MNERSRLPGVAHVLAPAVFGGLERVVHGLASGQYARGAPVSVVTVLDPDPDSAAHPFVSGLEAVGVPVTAIEVPHRHYRFERHEITDALDRLRPDVVHFHGARVDVVDGGIARLLGLPSVSTVHGFTGGGWRNRFYEWLQARALRRRAAVVAVSRQIRDRLERAGVEGSRLRVVQNAWVPSATPLARAAARDRLGIPAGERHVGFVGRLTPEKGCDVFVDALARLPDVRASVIGDGSGRAQLEAKSRAAGTADQIRWHGVVPDAGRLLPAFDVLVLSSRTEGTPIVLFEAMAAGVPLVATAVGGVPDVISDREAVLVPPEDPDAVARAVRQSLTDAETRTRVDAARRRLEAAFAVDPWLDAYQTVYRSLVP